MTPAELNALTDEALFPRVDATIRSRTEYNSTANVSCDALAQYVTLMLLNRVRERIVAKQVMAG